MACSNDDSTEFFLQPQTDDPLVQQWLRRPVHITGSGAVSVEGPLELIETGDGYLVGATATGVGTLRVQDGACSPTEVTFRVGRFPGLAGRSLEGYPAFEFVDAFNIDEQVQTALDPVRHSDRVGLPYDVYVVAHRTPEEWAADNSLDNVGDVVEAGLVAEGSIASNTTLAWSESLPVPELVVQGYDVIYDFGQDGELSPGDLIDGLGDRAGFYVVQDLAEPGPYEVQIGQFNGGTWLKQRVYAPTEIEKMGQLPLVVLSHGNGHKYTWYDYLGEHLASYGFIVTSHSNNTGPGPGTAATSTLDNTDHLLEQQGEVLLGTLDGHIDSHNISWIGHSRGGEGVVRAYHRLVDGSATPQHFTVDDIKVVSSIAPTVFKLGVTLPHEVTYHLIAGASDGDVTGDPSCNECQFFRIPGISNGRLQITYIQGAAHNDFHGGGGWDDGKGPDRIGAEATHVVAKSYYLALLSRHIQGNAVLDEYFARMNDSFRPPAIGPQVLVSTTFRPGINDYIGIIDDFQEHDELEVSSSGGVVSADVGHAYEGLLDDNNSTFNYVASDPMNGMTYVAGQQGWERGMVFDWENKRYLEFEVVETLQDFTAYDYLSFRACQGTRHPQTTALNGPLSFSATLRDLDGVESTIDLGVYGRINRPYLRQGYGQGQGWANEFNTVRIRLTDFETDGSGVNLKQVAALRFDFGEAYGSTMGRVGLDDVLLSVDME